MKVHFLYIPGTQLTLVLIGKGLVLGGWPSKIEVSWVLGLKYIQNTPGKFNTTAQKLPSQKETSLSTMIFWGLCQTSGGHQNPDYFNKQTPRGPDLNEDSLIQGSKTPEKIVLVLTKNKQPRLTCRNHIRITSPHSSGRSWRSPKWRRQKLGVILPSLVLVGGWTNSSKKYISQTGLSPQGSGWI